MFKGLTFVLATMAVIAIIGDFRVAGLPKPQQDDSSFTFVDGFAFDGGAERNIPIRPPSSTRTPAIVQTTRPIVVPSPDATIPATTESPTVTQCIRNCPVTSEYNLVCGTNGIVYDNPSKLACAKNCGVDVQQAFYGPCISRIRG